MDGDVLTIELIALLKTALPSDRQRVDDSLKRRRSRIGTGAHKSNRFSLTATEPRVRSSARSRVKAGAHNKIVFASPRFTTTAPSAPQIFDESACDQDSATVVNVVESFNPYTSLESGSYSGITTSSNDEEIDEVVTMVTIMHVEELETSMPYIS